MRPLVRNTLWLGFAAACGLAGAWFGMDYGAGMGAQAAYSLQASHDAQQALDIVDLALDLLEQPISERRRLSVDFRLREALGFLGASTKTLQGWWTCPRSGPATLARARVYLRTHPERPSVLKHYYVDEGLALCEAVLKPRNGH